MRKTGSKIKAAASGFGPLTIGRNNKIYRYQCRFYILFGVL